MTYRHIRPLATIVLSFSALLLFAVMPLFAHAQASTTTDTVFLQINKLVSPAHFGGVLAASDFSFTVTGGGVNEVVDHAGIIELEVGSYSITESYGGSDSIGFDPAQWTVLWAGDVCVGENIPATQNGTLTVLESDIGKFVENNPGRCNAENQFKPGTLQVTKVVVGTSTTPDNFSFTINDGDPIAFDSSGSNDVEVPAGDYEIAEVAVSGYTTALSAGCSGTVANNEKVQCTITNTYVDPTVVSGCMNPDAVNYDELATQDDGSCNFVVASSTPGSIAGLIWNDLDGNGVKTDDLETGLPTWTVTLTNASNTVSENTTTNGQGMYSFAELEDDSYTVCQTLQSGWMQTFPSADACHDVEIFEGQDVTGVDFGNKEDGGGGGSSDPDTYRIEGYVWHDNNENELWDGFQDEDPSEDEQSGWVVEITNGEDTFSTITDEFGYYFFEVEAGTWTITEVLQEGWSLITPVSGSHVVTVPDQQFTQSFSEKLFALVVPTAHAAVLGTYGPFDFGNNESDTDDGGGSGGCFNCIKSRGGGGSPSSDDPLPDLEPIPQVLGDQVTLVPVGAPNAGNGGMSPSETSVFDLALLLSCLTALWAARRYRA